MIHEVINDPTSSFSDVAKVISMDTALSARLLKIVNSAFYSFPSNIETITHAVSLIGTEQLYELALATTVLTTFRGIPDKLLNMNDFWRHSMAVGLIARNLAIHNREANSERFYLAGILHDVGRLIILENLPEQSHEIFDMHNDKRGVMHEIERDVLGFDHAEVGASLAKAWKLPLSLEEIIAFHHRPGESKRFPLETAIVNLADVISKSMELGSSGDPYVHIVENNALDIVGLSPRVLPSVWSQTATQYEENVEIVLSR